MAGHIHDYHNNLTFWNHYDVIGLTAIIVTSSTSLKLLWRHEPRWNYCDVINFTGIFMTSLTSLELLWHHQPHWNYYDVMNITGIIVTLSDFIGIIVTSSTTLELLRRHQPHWDCDVTSLTVIVVTSSTTLLLLWRLQPHWNHYWRRHKFRMNYYTSQNLTGIILTSSIFLEAFMMLTLIKTNTIFTPAN